MKKVTTFTLLSTLILTGCTTTNMEICDPKNTHLGILDKMSCNYSGHYQERINEKEKILLDEQATNKQFKTLYAEIERQKNDSSLKVNQKQAELNNLTKNLTKLTNELKQKTANRKDLRQQIDDIELQLKTVQKGTNSEMEKQLELDALNQKLQKLQSALNL